MKNMNICIARIGGVSLAVMALSLLAEPSQAQTAPPEKVQPQAAPSTDSGNSLEDIVVTARKVGEASQSLPITITAYSGKELSNKVVLNVQDLESVTPGLTISTNAEGNAPIFAIRGSATENLIQGSVAVYLNDVPLISTIGIVNAFYDISTVEILKGPQGTQFGTNTTGGTITVRSNLPTDKFEAYLKAGYGNYNRRELEGMVNIPVTDDLKFRFAGNYVKRDGYVNDPIGAGVVPGKFSNEDHYSGRGTMSLDKGPVSSVLIVDYYHENQLPIPVTPVAFEPTALGIQLGALGAQTGSRNTVYIGPDPSGNQRNYHEIARLFGLEHRLTIEASDNLSIRNVIGYRHDYVDSSENDSGTTPLQINVLQLTKNDEWNDDLTLRYKSTNNRFKFNLGGYFSGQKRAVSTVANADQALFIAFYHEPIVVNIQEYGVTNDTSNSIYANSDFDITNTLGVSGGIRYNWDHSNLFYSDSQGRGLPQVGDVFFPTASTPCSAVGLAGLSNVNLAACTATNAGSWRAPSYNFVLNNHFSSKVLAYAKISHGYLAGGLNTTIREVHEYNPETNTQYEGGLKADWFIGDRPIRTNIAIYYSKIKNKQVVQNTNYDDGGSGNGVFNAARETIYGADFDLRFSPVQGVTLVASYNYTHAKFDEFSFPAIGGPSAATLEPSANLSGNTPAQTPKHQVNVSASYEWPIASTAGRVTTTITGYYTSAIAASNVFTPYNAQFGAQYNTIDGYFLASASANWDHILGSPISGQLWVRNLLDKNYVTFRNDQFQVFGYSTAIFGAPRTYGVSASVKF